MQRCGHHDYGTTLRYIREAEAVRDGLGELFPALPPYLLDSPWQPSRGTLVARAASDDENIAFSLVISGSNGSQPDKFERYGEACRSCTTLSHNRSL
jgi:hypothetical protein